MFDPNFPPDHSELDGAPYRDQFNSLKGLIDAQQTQIAALQQQVTALKLVLTANNLTMSLDWTYNGPPCDEFHIFAHQTNDAPGVFIDYVQVGGDLRSWGTDFDDPADAEGYAYYIVPMDGDGNPLSPQSNTVSFA